MNAIKTRLTLTNGKIAELQKHYALTAMNPKHFLQHSAAALMNSRTYFIGRNTSYEVTPLSLQNGHHMTCRQAFISTVSIFFYFIFNFIFTVICKMKITGLIKNNCFDKRTTLYLPISQQSIFVQMHILQDLSPQRYNLNFKQTYFMLAI